MENWKTWMDDAEVKLDKLLTVRIHNSLNSIQDFKISGMVGRFSVRKLLKVDVMCDLAKGPSL